MSEERIQGLEEKVAYLEKNLAELDSVVRDLSGQLEAVTTQMKRFMHIERVLAEDAPSNDPPPHY